MFVYVCTNRIKFSWVVVVMMVWRRTIKPLTLLRQGSQEAQRKILWSERRRKQWVLDWRSMLLILTWHCAGIWYFFLCYCSLTTFFTISRSYTETHTDNPPCIHIPHPSIIHPPRSRIPTNQTKPDAETCLSNKLVKFLYSIDSLIVSWWW